MITALVLVWFLEWYYPRPAGGYDFFRDGPYFSEQECSAAEEMVVEFNLDVEQMECVGPEELPKT